MFSTEMNVLEHFQSVVSGSADEESSDMKGNYSFTFKAVMNMGFKENEKTTLCVLTSFEGETIQTRFEFIFLQSSFIMFHSFSLAI